MSVRNGGSTKPAFGGALSVFVFHPGYEGIRIGAYDGVPSFRGERGSDWESDAGWNVRCRSSRGTSRNHTASSMVDEALRA